MGKSKKQKEAEAKKKKEDKAKRKAEAEAKANTPTETTPEKQPPETPKEEEKQDPEEKKEDEVETHEGLVRVKLLRSLYFPINGRKCSVSCNKDDIVRVSKEVFEDHKEDLKALKPGLTTREMIEKEQKKRL